MFSSWVHDCQFVAARLSAAGVPYYDLAREGLACKCQRSSGLRGKRDRCARTRRRHARPPLNRSTVPSAARGNMIPAAALAALAIEHGVPLICSNTDFARFRELTRENPLY